MLPLIKANHSAKFAFLPNGQDPDSIIRNQGKKAFSAVIDGSIDLAEFLWMHHTSGQKFNTPESRAGLSKTLDDEADKITDRNVQHYYKQFFRQKLYDNFRSQNSYKKQGKGSKKPYKSWVNSNGANDRTPNDYVLRRPAYSKEKLSQQILLATIINHPWMIDEGEELLADIKIDNERLDLLRQNVLNILCGCDSVEREELQHKLLAIGFQKELSLLLSDNLYIHAGYARPKAERDIVLEGWKERANFINKELIQRELKKARKEFVADFIEDKNQQIVALQLQGGDSKEG